MKRARTITIFLTTGNPNGIKKLEVSNRIIRAYVIPRIKISDIKNFPELTQPSLYLLLDKDGEKAYIGESENFYDRIKNHDQNKDFWNTAVAFIAKDKSLEKGDVKYLESVAVESSLDAKRIEMINKTIPPKNSLHEFKIPTIEEFFEDIKLLTTTLGYSIFDKIQTEGLSENQIWYLKGKNTEARATYSESGFTLLAGSLINITPVPSFFSNFPKEALEREAKILINAKKESEYSYKLLNNITFSSVSRASGFCLGRASNGWLDWKNSANKSMDEVMRKGPIK